MARGRIISTEISHSETVEAMSEWAQLLWDRIIVHTDDFGRFYASPAKVKAICKPMSNRPIEDFASAIAEMAAAGVLVPYTSDGKLYLHCPSFDEHQSGLHKRTNPKFPDPETELNPSQYLSVVSGDFPELPENSGPSRREEKRKKKGREEKKEARASARDLVENFSPNEDQLRWAQEKAPDADVELETENWRDRMRANKYRTNAGPVADAAASWRTAIRNAQKWAPKNGAKERKPAPSVEQVESNDPTEEQFQAYLVSIVEAGDRFVLRNPEPQTAGEIAAWQKQFGATVGEDYSRYLRARQRIGAEVGG